MPPNNGRGPIDGALRERAARVLPAGVYGHESTRMLPGSYPQFYERAQGAHLWDVDGNRYLDLMCAYGPNLLGYHDERVDAAAAAQAALGDTMTGPSARIVELAEALVAMVSHADWALLCKNGTDATTMAMTAARAQTRRRRVLVADHSYHGAAPWCTPVRTGVVMEERAFISTYTYNDVASLEAAVAAAGDDLAAVFATPFKHDSFEDQLMPDAAYARRARELCDAADAMLIVDDIRAGLRLARDCSWELLGVRPDMSTWGKTLANGLPISALLGSDRCRRGAGAMYVTGSFWFAGVPMAAAIETLRIVHETDYLERMVTLGEQLRHGLNKVADAHGFGLRQSGPVQMPQVMFDDDPDLRVGFAFTEEMVARGVLVHPWHNMFLCASMTSADIDAAIDAADDSLAAVRARRDTLEPHPIIAAMNAAR